MGAFCPSGRKSKATLTLFISLAMPSYRWVSPFFLSSSSALATVVGTSILNLWVFFIYLGFLFITKEIMGSRFFNIWGAQQLNASSWDMPWQWSYYSVSTGWDSFRSLSFFQYANPYFHWQHTCHPTVKQHIETLPFTTIFWSSIESVGLVYENQLCRLTIRTVFRQGHIVHTWIRKLHFRQFSHFYILKLYGILPHVWDWIVWRSSGSVAANVTFTSSNSSPWHFASMREHDVDVDTVIVRLGFRFKLFKGCISSPILFTIICVNLPFRSQLFWRKVIRGCFRS